MCFQRRGRCPHRPAGYVDRAVKKNGHARTVGFRADVGIGPYKISIIVFLLCNPGRFFFLHSSFIGCGDLPANPSTSGLESFPLSTTSDFVCRGRCPHGLAMEFDELSRKTKKFPPQLPGPYGHRPYGEMHLQIVLPLQADMTRFLWPQWLYLLRFLHSLFIVCGYFHLFFSSKDEMMPAYPPSYEKSPQGIQTLWRKIQEQGRGC